MTQRTACPPVPGPLEDYAHQFDDLFSSLAQRRGFLVQRDVNEFAGDHGLNGEEIGLGVLPRTVGQDQHRGVGAGAVGDGTVVPKGKL